MTDAYASTTREPQRVARRVSRAPAAVMGDDPSERERRGLAESFARGEPAAFEAAYRRYGPSVAAFVRAAVGADHAEDVVQEVFVYAWRRRQRYRPDLSALGTWLVMVARSRLIDHHRMQGRRTEDALPPDLEGTDPGGIDALMSTWAFAAMLADLPEMDRRIMALRFQGGLSQTEIAEQLDMPLGTVKTRMNRALQHLRTGMAAVDGTPG